MNKSNRSAEDLVGRWEERREIKNLMGRYAVSFLLKKEAHHVCGLLEPPGGCLHGPQRWLVSGSLTPFPYGSAAIDTRHCAEGKAPSGGFAGASWGIRTLPTLYGIGDFDVKPLGTPVIELAEDLQDRQGHLVLSGHQGRRHRSPVRYPIGPSAYLPWTLSMKTAHWKIWHLQYLEDIKCLCGQSWAKPGAALPRRWTAFAPLKDISLPEPTVKTVTAGILLSRSSHGKAAADCRCPTTPLTVPLATATKRRSDCERQSFF